MGAERPLDGSKLLDDRERAEPHHDQRQSSPALREFGLLAQLGLMGTARVNTEWQAVSGSAEGRNMHRLACLLLMTLLTTTGASSHPPHGEQSATPVGVWMNESERVQVEIAACGDRFCGRIVWLSWLDDPQDLPLIDLNNSDPVLRTRPLVGLIVLRDLRRAAAGSWVDGRIYNPVDGKDYSALMSIQEDGSLWVRVYVLHPLFGQTQHWSRVSYAVASDH